MKKYNRQGVNTKKIIKIVFIILYQILVIMALILAMVIVLQRVSNSNKSIGGYRIFRVISGSMEPEYAVGEVVISKEVKTKDIKVGDDIVYLGRNGEYAGKIIMHNVVGIETDEKGDLIFHAKGLQSNSLEDPQIREEQIYGVVKYKSDFLTVLYNLATNVYSIFFIIIILVINVFIAFNTPKKTKKKRKVKQIANISDEEEEEFYEEEIEEDLEEDIDDEIEEDEIEENEISENAEHIKYQEKKDKTLEKNKREEMIREQMKQMLNQDKNKQYKNGLQKKNKE